MIEIKSTGMDPATTKRYYSVGIEDLMTHKGAAETLVREIIELVAQRYVEENFVEIVKGLDQAAIANLSVAAAGAKVSEILAQKLPDRVMVVQGPTEKEVWQRGITGRMTRIR